MRGGLATRGRPSPTIKFCPESGKWQDVARATPAAANNDPVGSLADIAGATFATQATAGNRPLLKTAVLDGYDVIQTDGVNDSLAGTMAALTQQTWVIVARKMTAATAAQKTVFGISQSTSLRLQVLSNTAVGAGWLWFPNEAVGSVIGGGTVTNWSIIALSFMSSSSAFMRVNGGAGIAFDPYDVINTSVAYQFGMQANSTTFGDYQYAEVRRYQRGLDIGDTNYIGKELVEKYPSLSWSLAA